MNPAALVEWFRSHRWLVSLIYALSAASPFILFLLATDPGNSLRRVMAVEGVVLAVVVFFGWGLFLHQKVASGDIEMSERLVRRAVLIAILVLVPLGLVAGATFGGD